MACLFCRIIDRELDSNIVFEDQNVIVIRDINPQAPVHLLVIPRKHITTINEVQVEDTALLGHMITVAKDMAHEEQIDEPGYRLVFNVNRAGGQEVYHIHLHVMGGRPMTWPPG